MDKIAFKYVQISKEKSPPGAHVLLIHKPICGNIHCNQTTFKQFTWSPRLDREIPKKVPTIEKRVNVALKVIQKKFFTQK